MQVQDIGPPRAKIMIVGEAPGREEDIQGIPFCGSSGSLLKLMLNAADINFEDCYVTNVIDRRPPHNDFSIYYTDKRMSAPAASLDRYYKILFDKIAKIKPNLVIALGNEALRALTGHKSISAWRGSLCFARIPELQDPVKVLPTYHPAYILRDYKQKSVCQSDLVKARRFAESPKDLRSLPKITILPTYQQAIESLFYILSKKPRVAFDIETTPQWNVRCLGLAYRREDRTVEAISIPFSRSNMLTVASTQSKIALGSSLTNYWPAGNELAILNMLADVFADPDIEKVGQNSLSFDQPILEKAFGFEFVNHMMDTMHAHHTCYLELPKGLDFLCSLYTDYSNYWSAVNNADDRSHATYNAWDCAATLVASEAIDDELEQLGVKSFYYEHVHKLATALARASERGVAVDRTGWDAYSNDVEAQINKLEKEINELAGRKLNPKSPKQLKEFLYDERRLPEQRTKGSVTTDETALRKLYHKNPNEKILHKILEHRKLSKIQSTYLKINFDDDGYLRTSYNASGTDTGRISSSSTIRNTGTNLQNIPPLIRQFIVARPGCSLVAGDLSQAETLVVAHILRRYGDHTLYERYKNPEFDIHRWAAADIFGEEESAVTKFQRSVGKLANHSGNYCAGPQVLVTQSIKREITGDDGELGISYNMSKRILDRRHRLLPGLRKWWNGVSNAVRATRRLTTVFGRVRVFLDRVDDYNIRTAVAYEPQSTVGDLCNYIFYKLESELPDGCYPLLQVHDEVVVECPDELVERCKLIMQKVAQYPLSIYARGEPLIIPLEVKSGKNWLACK